MLNTDTTEYRQNVIKFITNTIDNDYTLALTLNFSLKKKGMSLEEMNKALRHWTHAVNKSLYGKHWKQRAIGLRYFAFAELTESYPHFHLIVDAPKDKMEFAPALLCNKWLRLAGVDSKLYSAKCQPVHSVSGWIAYCAKEITEQRNNYWDEKQILAKEWV